MSFTSDSWKKTGGINRTSSHNLVRIPKAIEGSLKVYENTNSSNITIDGNSHLRINKGTDLNGNSGTIFGTYRIGQDVSSNIYDPRVLIRMTTDPIRNNDWAFFMSESANGNVDRGNLTLVVADNSTSQNDKFIIRGYDEASKKNTDIAYFSSEYGAVFNKVGIGLSAPRVGSVLDISGIAYGTYPLSSVDHSGNQLPTVDWVTDNFANINSNWITNGEHIYNGNTQNVGIGISNPQSNLDVSGGVAIGSSFTGSDASANSITSPINGLIVEGNVGIGISNPTEKLEIDGICTSTSFNATSDIRFKSNVTQLDNSLEKICSIRGVNYNWTNDEKEIKHGGVIAQEILKQIPEAVNTSNPEKFSVDYNAIIGHLIESVKTLKMEIEELKSNK